jgi:hypothetical protein
MASGAKYTVAKNDPRYQRVANESVSNTTQKSTTSSTSGGSSSSSNKSSTSSSKSSSSSGIDSATYDEIVRKAQAGIPLTNPTPEKQALYDAYASAYSVSSSGGSGSNKKESNTLTLEDYISQLSNPMDNYNMPYEQLIRDIISQAPTTSQKSQSELENIAKNYASLQITPQLEALQRSIEQAITTANSQKEAIEAAYASVPQQTQAMLDEARRYAQESAIARGAGQSGVVNWETEKQTTPIMQQAQQYEAEKAAKLNAVADWLAGVQSQGAEQEQQLAKTQGDLTQQYLQLLTEQNESKSASDWERIFNSISSLANAAQSANLNSQNWATSLLPYFMQTASEEATMPLQWTQVIGQVPQTTTAGQNLNLDNLNLDNEKQYLLNQLSQARKSGNKGLESWILAQAKQYGIDLGG